MQQISNIHIPVGPEWKPASGQLSALVSGRREGMAILPRDLPPAVVSEAKAQAALAKEALRPASPGVIMAWLKKLAPMVANAPADAGAVTASAEAIIEICGDLPAGVWSPAARKSWITQGRDAAGRLPGTFWPRPSELYATLRPIADRIASELDGCRALIAIAENAPEPARTVPTHQEREAVAAAMAEVRAQQAARDAEEQKLREFGLYMPGNDVSLRGPALIAALKADLPKMSAEMREVTELRIASLQKAHDFAEQIGAGAGDSA
ncbi:hypothetical protein [Gluconacetobacter asukensis]|uniref:Uncharacterized protein n=1 Tax=Gluconacetobacter asukensis TaxID=1017181 RepID=A0A7W4J1Q1_9PROT|nr:hypothetical protein [Gluconacetobacter asukensis]MBB2172862.1 hypothetical protein [Gluconacetobacter asukensis]